MAGGLYSGDLIAWLLIAFPVEIIVPDPDLPPRLRSHLRTVAVELELIEPDECTWDLPRLRGLYAELQDAPRLRELDRFPPHAVACDQLRLIDARIESLKYQRAVSPGNIQTQIDDALEALACRRSAWEWLADAQQVHCYCRDRRRAASALRDILGPAHWAAGRMP